MLVLKGAPFRVGRRSDSSVMTTRRKRIKTRTATKASHKCDPTNPAPPVTRTRLAPVLGFVLIMVFPFSSIVFFKHNKNNFLLKLTHTRGKKKFVWANWVLASKLARRGETSRSVKMNEFSHFAKKEKRDERTLVLTVLYKSVPWYVYMCTYYVVAAVVLIQCA